MNQLFLLCVWQSAVQLCRRVCWNGESQKAQFPHRQATVRVCQVLRENAAHCADAPQSYATNTSVVIQLEVKG